jgi:hypothetical protein
LLRTRVFRPIAAILRRRLLAAAPTTILSATLVTSGTSYPYCDVDGIVAPQVQFELRLPTETYTRRYL